MNEQTEPHPLEIPNDSESYDQEKRCVITVPNDSLTAYLRVTEKFRSEITLEEVKDALKTAGVTF